MSLSAKTPPPRLARAVETARLYLYRLHQKMSPPYAVMLEMILAGLTSVAESTIAVRRAAPS